ncbi:MAG: GNAT family N-acetyltransferase [Dehalococcoidia bacterium]
MSPCWVVFVEIVQFAVEHIDGAAALLAMQHRLDRAAEPALPPRFEDRAVTRAWVEESVSQSKGSGVTAMAGGRVVGFMLGIIETPDPLSTRALMDPPRAGHLINHAVDPEGGAETYQRLYAALAPCWVERGVFSHNLGIAASDGQALGAWSSLGFGQASAHGLRDTSPLAAGTRAGGLSIRRGHAGDADAMFGFVKGLYRHLAAPPSFMPYLPEVEPAIRREATEFLTADRYLSLLAERSGRPVGAAIFWRGMPRKVAPEKALWLTDAYVEPAERGRGSGLALVAAGLAAACGEGYEWCLLNYLTANLAASRFWLQTCGFRPITYHLTRNVDVRAAWGSG